MKRFGFSSKLRLTLDREVERVQTQGRRASAEWGVLFWSRREGSGPGPRLALRVPKKAGNAVRRNRIRRLLREAFRLNREGLDPHLDLLIAARPGTFWDGADLARVTGAWQTLCRKAGLLSEERT